MPQDYTNELFQAIRGGGAYGQWQYVYPKTLVETNHWICFRANKRVFMQHEDYPVTNDIGRIFMPMPADLGTRYGQNYNSEGIGLAGKLASDVTSRSGNMMNGAGISDIVSQVTNGITTEGVVDFGQYYASAAAEELGGAIGAKLFGGLGAIGGLAGQQAVKGGFAGAGLARNPYMAVMYNNPEFREHQFSWKLISQSYQDSQVLYNLIKKLKYHAAPNINTKNPHFFEYPEQWDIDFSDQRNTFNIGPSVLKNIDVNYHAEGKPLYFRNPEDPTDIGPANPEAKCYPVSVKLELSFQEVFVITKDNINNNR